MPNGVELFAIAVYRHGDVGQDHHLAHQRETTAIAPWPHESMRAS